MIRTITLLLTIFPLVVLANGSNQERVSDTSDQEANKAYVHGTANKESRSSLAGPTSQINATDSQTPKENDGANDDESSSRSNCPKPTFSEISVAEQDLHQQTRMADSTEEIAGLTSEQLWVNGVGAFFVIATFIFTAIAARAAQRSAEAAESVIKQNRAYITRGELFSKLIYENPNKPLAGVIITIEWKNSGNSPALDFFAYTDIINISRTQEIPIFTPNFNTVNRGATVIGKDCFHHCYWNISANTISQIQEHELDCILYMAANYRDIHGGEFISESTVKIEFNIDTKSIRLPNDKSLVSFQLNPVGRQNNLIQVKDNRQS